MTAATPTPDAGDTDPEETPAAIQTGDRLRVTYVPVVSDLADGAARYGAERVLTGEVVGVRAGTATRETLSTTLLIEADDGRLVSLPLAPAHKTVRARAADRESGTFRQSLGQRRSVEVLEA